MYLDILADNNYINMNIKLARITDIYTAVYFAEVLNIIRCVIKKQKFDENGFFMLDRDYIEERTTINKLDQLNCDALLSRLDVVKVNKDNPDEICVNLELFTALLTSSDIKKLDSIAKKAKVSKATAAANKKEIIISNMKNAAVDTDQELNSLYRDWVQAVYDNKRYLTKKAIELFKTTINNYTTDKTIKLKLLETAIIHGYPDATWVINAYAGNRTTKNTAVKLPQQKIVTEVSDVIL